jgi:tetratricopeptide (TPR) repeat protein/uncharacterized caspase-like protein
MIRRFNFAFLLAIQIALFSHAPAQPSAPQRPKAQTQNRDLQVKEMRSGAALDGRGNLWAVVIGVSRYKNLPPKAQLEFAHRDAESFANFLRSPNGGGFPSSHLTLLTNQAATLSAVRSAIGTTLPRSVEPDDVVVIYFAGHGVVEGERDGYLLAHDSDPQNLYATGLQLSELNRIITERLKARTVILIADACHSGQLGLTSRGMADDILVNRYLEEIGNSGKGVFRLLASRQDQRSYEGKTWGGGHGVFTWFLLKGLGGDADRDKDGVVRVGELLDFLSETVPKATQSLQHPRAAGDIDPRLAMAVLSAGAPGVRDAVALTSRTVSLDPRGAGPPNRPKQSPKPAPQLASLEVRGAPGSAIYLDKSFRGRVPPSGSLVIERLKFGSHDLLVRSPNTEPINQKLSLTTTTTILEVNGTASASSSSPLAAEIKQALNNKDIGAAFNLYQQLIVRSPKDPQRANIEAALGAVYESIGQNAINVYVQSSGMEVRPGMFREAAEAFRFLKIVTPNTDQSIEAKLNFCQGKANFDNNQFQEAVERLKIATQTDPRAAYAFSALGMAYRSLKRNDLALDAFKRAAELAPSWALPQLQMGYLYRDGGDMDRAKESFKNAERFDPRYPHAQEQIMLIQLLKGEYKQAEQSGNEILAKFPNSGRAHLYLGQIYQESKRWVAAAEAYEKGLTLTSDITPEEREDYTKRIKRCRKKGK